MRLTNIIIREIQRRYSKMTLAQQVAATHAIFSLLIFEENKEAFHNSTASELMQQTFAKDLDALTKALS